VLLQHGDNLLVHSRVQVRHCHLYHDQSLHLGRVLGSRLLIKIHHSVLRVELDDHGSDGASQGVQHGLQVHVLLGVLGARMELQSRFQVRDGHSYS